MKLHIAVVGPMDVGRLVAEFGLMAEDGQSDLGILHDGHPATTSLIIGLAALVDRLDLVTLDSGVEEPICMAAGHVRLAVGPQRPRPRDRARDLFSSERHFVAERLRSWRPDAVSAHWTYEFALGALDSRLPHLVTVHDWAPAILWSLRDRYRAIRLVMQLLTFARGRNFAAVSPYMARRSRLFTFRPVAVLPNGLERSWYDGLRERPVDGSILAVNHGFGRHKNVKRLLAAWPSVLEQHPETELVLVGEGYAVGGPANRWADEKDLAQGVRFLGPVGHPELKGLLQSASVFAHPSLEESFGLVVLEAMARGVPVLGGLRSGAVPWLLRDGAGVLVDVRKPRAIADGLNKLLAEPHFARATVRRGYERSLDFAIEEIALAYQRELAVVASRTT